MAGIEKMKCVAVLCLCGPAILYNLSNFLIKERNFGVPVSRPHAREPYMSGWCLPTMKDSNPGGNAVVEPIEYPIATTHVITTVLLCRSIGHSSPQQM